MGSDLTAIVISSVFLGVGFVIAKFFPEAALLAAVFLVGLAILNVALVLVWPDAQKKRGCSLSAPARRLAPSLKEAPSGWPGLPWLVVAITTKRPGSAGALAALTGDAP